MSEPYYSDDAVTIYHGDAADVLPTLPDESIQLVLTDPPYPEEFQHVWHVLGQQSARLLADGGSLVTLLGHYQLPFVVDALGAHLRFWWVCGMDQQPSINRLIGKQVGVAFKPALWYVKGTRRRSDSGLYPVDLRSSSQGDKRFHEWGQPVGWFTHLMTSSACAWIRASTRRSTAGSAPRAGRTFAGDPLRTRSMAPQGCSTHGRRPPMERERGFPPQRRPERFLPELCHQCRPGLCHLCGAEGPDCVLMPHTGTVLCDACVQARLAAKRGVWKPLTRIVLRGGGHKWTREEASDG